MIPTVLFLTLLTIGIAAFVLAPKLVEHRIVFDNAPDTPAAFGYRMAWIAVRTTDMRRVVDVLRLGETRDANWRTGIGTVYDGRLGETYVYVTPPVQGWVFVVGLALPQPLGRNFVDKCTPMLLDLAVAFPEAQYFLAHPPIDFYAWARVADGKLTRAFAIGDDGVIWNKGKIGKDERSLGLRLNEVRGVRGRKADGGVPLPVYPTEAHVLHLAGCWSLDPTTLDPTTSAARPAAVEAAAGGMASPIGLVCAAPSAWRPERLRKTG